MTILHSCCCWRSVRKGSFACGCYTAGYYTFNAVVTSITLSEELKHFRNESDAQDSVIDHDTTTETTMIFSIVILTLSSLGIFTTCLLLYGVYRDFKILLIPWIFHLLLYVMVDCAYLIYSFIYHALEWNPFAAILITLDIFLNTLNIYALLCVISQYQELKAGRGRALDDQMYRAQSRNEIELTLASRSKSTNKFS